MSVDRTNKEIECLRRKGLVRLGDIFKKLSRLCYSKTAQAGFCWCCGSDVGMQSTLSRGLVWCNDCYRKWDFVIRDRKFLIDWRGVGYLKNKGIYSRNFIRNRKETPISNIDLDKHKQKPL